METKATVRRGQLRKLITDQFGGSHSSFGEVAGLSLSQIGQWLSGSRNMGEKSARTIEIKLHKPEGWMDGNVVLSKLDDETLDLAARIQNLSQADKAAMLATLDAWTKARENAPHHQPARRASDRPSFGRGGPLQTPESKEIQTADAKTTQPRGKTKHPHSA